MAAHLTAGLLDGARPALARLVVHAVLLQGRRPLDAILCLKSRDEAGWPRRLLPFADLADSVTETDEAVLLGFSVPREFDCAALGGLMPLARQGGVLASAELADPGPQLAAELAGEIVLVLAGERRSLPLAQFRRLDIVALFDLASVQTVADLALPLLVAEPARARPLRTRTAVPFDPEDTQAGFAEVRRRLRRPVKRRWSERLRDTLRRSQDSLGSQALLRITVASALAVLVAVMLTELSTRAGIGRLFARIGAILTHLIEDPRPLFYFLVAAVIFYLRHRRQVGVSQGQGAATPSPAATAARSSLWRRLAGLFRARGTVLSEAAAAPAAAPPQAPHRRGLLGRLGAWLLWHTPAADRIARAHERRLAEVEALFREGRIEEALRKAISLATPEEKRDIRRLLEAYGDLPLQGPGMRRNLDLDFSGQRQRAGLGVTPQGHARLTALYRQKAKDLAEQGELDHAVFIHAELLDDAPGAVDLLVRAGKFETAARLAQARRLPPGLFIPLWFRAGDKARALALAARHDAFQELWKELKPEDPFRAVLSRTWGERLAAAGYPARALEVTDWPSEDLEAPRRTWLHQALAGQPDGVIVARALKALPWSPTQAGGAAGALRMLAEGGPEWENERLALVRALLDSRIEGGHHPLLTAGARAYLAHALVPRLAMDEAKDGHRPERARLAGALAEAGDQFALRVDLRRLARVKKKEAMAIRSLTLAPSPPSAAVIDAIEAGPRRVLLGYRSGLTKLVDHRGLEHWRAQVNGLLAFVPIGEGHKILILREEFGERLLAVFDVATLQMRDLGAFPVLHFNRVASSGGWLVMAGRDVVMVDIPALLAQADEGEMELIRHWGVPMSEEGRPLCFIEHARDVAFAYGRDDGLAEWWRIDKATLRITCELWPSPPRDQGDGAWMAFIQGNGSSLPERSFMVRTATETGKVIARIPATREAELDLLAKAKVAGDTPPLLVMTGQASEHAARWTAGSQAGTVQVRLDLPSGAQFRIDLAGAQRAWVNPNPAGRSAVVFDDLGRVLLVDVSAGAVMMRLA